MTVAPWRYEDDPSAGSSLVVIFFFFSARYSAPPVFPHDPRCTWSLAHAYVSAEEYFCVASKSFTLLYVYLAYKLISRSPSPIAKDRHFKAGYLPISSVILE